MSNIRKTSWTPADLAARWEYHRASIPRLMARYGISGVKFGIHRQAGRRYSDTDVELVERLAKLQRGLALTDTAQVNVAPATVSHNT